ncbi:hypothetical protein BDN70DRAFT_871674 [Pholiota conissans]|uniref:Calcofluor white hypersensitive protein n=1 Tax=Pholiota conissans TaxID=109636 RepID=A0A9P5ZD55_9AGAR|nr:hypothetical protein BDN70DRAFT_871674 [Pholiota conissans]
MHAAALVRLHTLFAATAFLSALVVGCTLHYHKIVKNGVAQYPDEWFPSVSATIGDWFPERSVFQFLIALASGPRFALVFLQYFVQHASRPTLSTVLFFSGLVRTLSCGGWVYVTSSDAHDMHDFMMILYMVCNIPWMLGGIAATNSARVSVLRKRKLIAAAFFVSLIPLVYFFVQHKVHRIPGAYTRYAFFEWGLVFFDVLYDSITEQEFREAGLQISIFSADSQTMDKLEPTPGVQAVANATSTTDRHDESTIATPAEAHAAPDKALSDALTAALAPAPDGHKKVTEDVKDQKPASSSTSRARAVLSVLSDIYMAYVFWTLFTALIPTLFYFSVWELGIAGHEFALLSLLSPALLAMRAISPYEYIFGSQSSTNVSDSDNAHSSRFPPYLLELALSRKAQTYLQLGSLLGLAAYIIPSPTARLVLVACANALASVRMALLWAGVAEREGGTAGFAGEQGILLGIGLLISNVLKYANRGNNPLWPFINHKSNGWNKTGIALALLAILEKHTRAVTPRFANVSSAPNVSAKPAHTSITLSAVPFGALLFALHSLLGDASTLLAWAWTGYAEGAPRGPLPHRWAPLTTAAMALGLVLGVLPQTRRATRSPVWLVAGAGSAWVMYAKSGWEGYAGGLGHAVFLMSVLPLAFEKAAEAAGGLNMDSQELEKRIEELKVVQVYTAAMGVYCALNVASIFTVAYAFVPGGVYLRERTDLVLIVQTACLVPLFTWPYFSSSSPTSPVNSTSNSPKTSSEASTSTGSYSISRTLTFLLFCFTLPSLSALTAHQLRSRSAPMPYRPDAHIIRAGIWTVHFGIDNEGHDSQRGILGVIRDMELDIVGLLETDLHRTPFGNRDLSRLLVEEGNYYVDIGPGPNKHTWGCVLLSKFPIISTKHHLLPSPHGELAPAIEAVLDIYGTEVLVIVSHNGQEEDALDRELQSTALAEIMASSKRPVIFLGYVVSKPHAPRPNPYAILVDEGNVHDVDKDDMDRWCEYILYRGLYRTSYARISRGIITDTETQIAQFVLPHPEHGVVNDSVEARYLRAHKELLPEIHWFPMAYYGDAKKGGVNGHYYHVFNTPSYYRLPEGAVV